MQPTFANVESQRIYQDWRDNPRWHRVTRPYRAEDVIRLRSGRSPVQGEKAVAQGLWSTLTNGVSTESMRRLYLEEALIPAHQDDLAKTFANAQRIIAAGLAAAVLDANAVAAKPVPHLVAARLATDVHDTPLILMARVTASPGDAALAYACAPYADVIWYEASTFNSSAAKHFIDGVRRLYPRQLVAYSCPASAVEGKSGWDEELRQLGFCDVIAAQPRPSAAGADTTDGLHRDLGREIEQLIAHSLERGASRDFSGETFCEETTEKDLI